MLFILKKEIYNDKIYLRWVVLEKFSEKLKKFFSSESSLQRIPIYFFLTCVLLVVLICKLGETNHYLKEIAANGTDIIEIETKDEDYENVVDVYVETSKSIEDYIPLYEEITDNSSTTEKSNESTTKRSETTTKENTTKSDNTQQSNKDNKSDKTTYVLNISSKKIHLPDCSFVDRTKEENKKTVELTDQELQQYLDDGYTFCKTCGGD